MGLLGLARALPQMAILLFGGLLADAVDRRRLLMATQLFQCSVSSSLAILTVLGMISPAILFIASAFLALFGAVSQPASSAFVPSLVPREDLTSAIALNQTQRN